MDLRTWYKKIRDAEATLTGEHLVTISLATSEGGKEGVRTEVPRLIAARLIAEGRARVATDEEALAFHEKNRVALEEHHQEQAANRLQVVVIPADTSNKQRERS
jgi:molybdenum-dependent DNA-binding transcriptional regulator ModE